MKFTNLLVLLIVLSGAFSSALFGQAQVNEKEMLSHLEHVLKNASEQYLDPGPELYGKFMVCKDYQILAVFESEAEALVFAENHELGSVEIRQVIKTQDGVSTRISIPGAIRKISD